jgi:hypothetical protein
MTINNLSTEYKVVLCKDLKDVDPNNSINSDTQTFGNIDYIKREIRVWDCGSKIEVFKTLLHEIIHGALGILALDKMNNDEVFVEQLTEVLADTLIRNDLLRFNIK